MYNMNNIIDFSIITATFNAGKTVRKCLESVRDNRLENTEHFVADNLSADETPSILKEFPELKVLSESDNGIYNAMNKGIEHTKNEILAFLNADDFYLPGTLQAVRDVFEKHPESDIVYGNIVVNGREFKPVKGIYSFKGARIFHPATFIRRSLFEKLGNYDEKYRICADFDFFMRAKENGAVFTYIDKPLADFALGGVSTKQRYKTAAEMHQILLSHGYSKLFVFVFESLMNMRTLAAKMLKR